MTKYAESWNNVYRFGANWEKDKPHTGVVIEMFLLVLLLTGTSGRLASVPSRWRASIPR